MKGQSKVLTYNSRGSSRATVRRHYLRWRKEQIPPLPIRCDNITCYFHANPLIWNGKILPLILDHIHGNNADNRPRSLRLLCPNCDSQLPTRGGANKGRIKKSPSGFCVVEPGGDREFSLFAIGKAIKDLAIAADVAASPAGIDLIDCDFDNPVVVSGGLLCLDGNMYEVPDNGSHSIGSGNTKMILFVENA